MKQKIFVFLAVMLLAFQASALTLQVQDTTAKQGAKAIVSINAVGATELGAIDLKVSYDPKVLKFSGAETGMLSTNGMVESSSQADGTATLSFADTKGISSDGEVLKMSFDVIGAPGSSTDVSLEARAYGIDLKDMPAEVKTGTVSVTADSTADTQAKGEDPVPPSGNNNMMWILIIGGVLLLLGGGAVLLLVIALAAKKKKK
jgi:hypothetical protein